jgi:hypothetical protein
MRLRSLELTYRWLEQLLEDLLTKKSEAQKVAKELSSLMDVKAEEWVKDVKAARHEI